MLDREQELAECIDALRRAVEGRGSILVVQGPAGIGKSELLGALRQSSRGLGFRAMSARGLEMQSSIAFGGMRQLLEPAFRGPAPAADPKVLAGAARPAAALLSGSAGAGNATATSGGDEFAMLHALYWVVAGLAENSPLLLTLDDAHCLDLPTQRFVQFLAGRIDELRVVVALGTRPAADDERDVVLGQVQADPNSRVVRLGPLSRSAVAEMVASAFLTPPDPAFVDACVEVSGGNPFYLSELLREIERRDWSPTAEAASKVRGIGPESISVGVRFRGSSSADAFAFARALAVLGGEAPFDLAARLSGLSEAAAIRAADGLVRQGLLTETGGASVAHPIVRTAIYADIGPRERSAAHARAAEILADAGAPPEAVAAHLLLTEPRADETVVATLRAAADEASARGGPDVAATYLRRALAEPPIPSIRARVLLELARAEAASADPGAAAHFAEAFSTATDDDTRTSAAGAAAYALFLAGRTADATQMLSALAADLAARNDDRSLEVEAEIASIANFEPAVAALHRPPAERVHEDLPEATRGERMILCHLAYRRMLRSHDAGRAAAIVDRALGSGTLLAERGCESPEIAIAAMALVFAERVDAAEGLIDAAIAQARERGSRQGYAQVLFLRSLYENRVGLPAAAEADAQASLEITAASGQSVGLMVATAELVVARLELGALDAAGRALADIGLLDGDIPPHGPSSALLSARGRWRFARGDLDGALADLLECGRRNAAIGARQPAVLSWRPEAALVYRASGDFDRAWELAEEELQAARDWGAPGTIGAAQRLAAQLAEGDEAIDLLRAAVAALEESPLLLERARALVDLGAALRRANHRSDARDPLLRGLDLADRCGAAPIRARASTELAAIGVRPRRARLSGLESLTPSERRVAEMAAEGLGNREIAQALFVTRKTVEKHLGNVYAKLDLRSRNELGARFGELARSSTSTRAAAATGTVNGP